MWEVEEDLTSVMAYIWRRIFVNSEVARSEGDVPNKEEPPQGEQIFRAPPPGIMHAHALEGGK